MSYIVKENDFDFLLYVKIKPNSKIQKFLDDGGYLTIFLRSKPIQNKANRELINLIKKKLEISSNQIKILSGKKNPKKVLQIQFSEKRETQVVKDSLS